MALTIKKLKSKGGETIVNIPDGEPVIWTFTHPLGTVEYCATPMGFILNNVKLTPEELEKAKKAIEVETHH